MAAPAGAHPRRRGVPPVRVRKSQLTTIGDGIALLRQLSGDGGSKRLLIAVANAAEMRGAGGMILSYGELVGNDGQLDLERFGGIDEIAPPSPATVGVPEDFLGRFGSRARR